MEAPGDGLLVKVNLKIDQFDIIITIQPETKDLNRGSGEYFTPHFYMYSIIFQVFQGRPRGVVVYQYTSKKFAKIPKIHPNIPKINVSIVLSNFYCKINFEVSKYLLLSDKI